jgi:fibronectin type 3 domain-containing protein
MSTGARWCGAASLALVLAAAAACALKTNPLIPPSPRPEQVKNIKAATRDAVVFLSWPIPARNVEGVSMKPADFLLFRVFRAEFGRDRKKARYKPFAEITVTSPAPAAIRNGTVFWSDDQVSYGYIYGYRIRAVSARGGVSQQSEEVRITPLLSAAAPRGVAALGGDSYNLITWETVTTWGDGSPYKGFVGYNIYRGTEERIYDETPLNKEPLTAASYKDTGVVNNRTYFYIVRSVNSPAPPWKESLDSTEVSATPKDLTPPNRPTGLTTVPGIGRVFLTWNENKESDLAGYHVYRSTKHGKDYERLTEKPLARTTFSDDTVASGETYYYVISAVDQAGNESEYSLERKVHVEKLNVDTFPTNKSEKRKLGP